MSRQAKWEYLKKIYVRYRQASKAEKQLILNEYCRVCGCHRKHAIRKLNGIDRLPWWQIVRKHAPMATRSR